MQLRFGRRHHYTVANVMALIFRVEEYFVMASRKKAILKTQPNEVNPLEFVSSVEHPQRRHDALLLLELFDRVTALKPKMWGSSIIGYGRYACTYESGRSGEFFVTGFSPRKTALTIYVMPGYRDLSEKLSRLGKHKTGKSCLYTNQLIDIDMDVLEEIIRNGLDYMRSNYKTWDV